MLSVMVLQERESIKATNNWIDFPNTTGDLFKKVIQFLRIFQVKQTLLIFG